MNSNNPLDTFDPAAAWQVLPVEAQALIGAIAVEMVFAGFVSGDACADSDRLFSPANRDAAARRSDEKLLSLYQAVEAALPSLFGVAGELPAWAKAEPAFNIAS